MKKRLLKVLVIILFLLSLLFGYYFLHQKTGFSIPCVFNELMGVNCPGCGITRMLFSLIRFDIVEAFEYNQFMFIVLPIFAIVLTHDLYIYIVGKKNYWFKKIPKWIYITLLVLVFVWMILRNLPMFPYFRP